MRPDPGFDFATLSWDDATIFHLSEGVLVTSVCAGGPAANAEVRAVPSGAPIGLLRSGLQAGDVLTGIRWNQSDNGYATVKSSGDLLIALAQIPPGSKLSLTVERPSSKWVGVIQKAQAKGWNGQAEDFTPEMSQELLLSDPENGKLLSVEYTLPTK